MDGARRHTGNSVVEWDLVLRFDNDPVDTERVARAQNRTKVMRVLDAVKQ